MIDFITRNRWGDLDHSLSIDDPEILVNIRKLLPGVSYSGMEKTKHQGETFVPFSFEDDEVDWSTKQGDTIGDALTSGITADGWEYRRVSDGKAKGLEYLYHEGKKGITMAGYALSNVDNPDEAINGLSSLDLKGRAKLAWLRRPSHHNRSVYNALS